MTTLKLLTIGVLAPGILQMVGAASSASDSRAVHSAEMFYSEKLTKLCGALLHEDPVRVGEPYRDRKGDRRGAQRAEIDQVVVPKQNPMPMSAPSATSRARLGESTYAQASASPVAYSTIFG